MRNELKTISAYKPANPQLLNLMANENPYLNWEKELYDELISTLTLPFARYGEGLYSNLKTNYASYAGVESSQILIGNGSDSIIPVLFNLLANRKVATLDPDYFRYDQHALVMSCAIFKVKNEPCWVDEMISLVKEEKIEMVIFSNPNNPMGIKHDQRDIIKLLQNVDAYVVVDEAYYEYCGESALSLIKDHPNLIVLRTLSKGWGLASLRIGFAIAREDIISVLQVTQGVFMMSEIVTNMANCVLKNEKRMKEVLSLIIAERDRIYDSLKDLGFNVEKSYSNFLFFHHAKAREICDNLLQGGIAVAYFPVNGGALRISVGTKEENDRFLSSISNVMEQINA